MSHRTKNDEPLTGFPGRFWHRLEDGRIQCDLCPRYCRLRAGQRGLCFVRGSDGERMLLTTYGRSSGFCIDPIEKKPLNHFLPGTPVLSFGTAGCNLACKFCQNWDISKSREFDRLMDQAAPQTVARAAKAFDCRSVAFTYNDPIIFHEYAVDVAAACRAEGVKAVAVTAGYVTAEPRAEFYRAMDAANIDLKGFTERFYREICGGELGAVKETLVYVHRETDAWLEITTLLIPGENDSDAEIDALTRWIAGALAPDVPIHFTAFHPDWRMADRPPTPPATLMRARHIAQANGLVHVYTGNIHDPAGQSTYCPGCGTVVIGRDGYIITDWRLKDGACADCGHPIPGRFEPRPGRWGARRQTVRLAAFAA
jgi:pyruvate formate lyase activating enzyme